MFVRIHIALLIFAGCETSAFASEHEEFFEARVRPMLAKRCYECHRRRAEGGLRLDSRAAILKGGESGPAIVPGKAGESLLWRVLAGKHSEISMPPDSRLKDGEIKVFERWIAAGAVWPKAVSSARATSDEHGITDEERAFWSFQPVVSPTVPAIKGAWGVNPIDAFIARQHQQRGLTPTDPADAKTLIRRLTFDLTGLPPSPAEIARFESATRSHPEAARAELVERLLASKHYGERWAQHWLDLVRYADTAGDAADYPVPEAYKYRNWVIDAFNNDKPYGEFVKEQIAGDLMPTADEEESWQRTIATGYIAISRRIGVSPHGLRHITIEDTLNNLGKTFLGLSIGCARCHDHKFDPIPTADYYALYGIFDSTVYPHAGAEHKPYRSDFVYRVGKNESDRVLAAYREQVKPWHKKERAAFERYRDFQRKPINIPGYNRDVAWQEVLDLRDEIRKVVESFPNLETAFAASEGDAGDAAIQQQGEPNHRGPVVRRGFLQVLGGQTLPDELADGSGRLQLANWIADSKNPLTARVIVNRVWHHHFGRGLVSTASDFGVRGLKPSHPELLDFLAGYLIENGWSIKQLHRLIVSSRTYCMSSDDNPSMTKTDPLNESLWRANRQRLDAEQIRDSILTFSDQLDRSTGRRHPLPHRLTYFFRQHEPYVGNFDSQRRTIYLFRQRIRKNRFLDMFDGPDGNLHIGVRRPTTTTLQSLYLMNSEFIEEQSRQIAERVLESDDSHAERLTWAYTTIFGRQPTKEERKATGYRLQQLALQSSQSDNAEPQAEQTAWAGLVRAMLCSNEFVFVD